MQNAVQNLAYQTKGAHNIRLININYKKAKLAEI